VMGIDQAFVTSEFRAVAYGVADLGAGQHLAQVLSVDRRP